MTGTDRTQTREILRGVAQAFGLEDGSWEVLSMKTSIVVGSPKRIVKIARDEAGAQRMARGLIAAVEARANGVPALTALSGGLIKTSAGPAAVWERLEHVDTEPETLTKTGAQRWGAALAATSQVHSEHVESAGLAVLIRKEIETALIPDDLRERVSQVAETVLEETWITLEGPTSFAHGDAHLYNTLFLTDGSIEMIDWDWAGIYPVGWDLGYARTHLVLGCEEEERYEWVRSGYLEAGGIEGDEEALGKLNVLVGIVQIMSTESLDARLAAITDLVGTLEAWVYKGVEPASLS